MKKWCGRGARRHQVIWGSEQDMSERHQDMQRMVIRAMWHRWQIIRCVQDRCIKDSNLIHFV